MDSEVLLDQLEGSYGGFGILQDVLKASSGDRLIDLDKKGSMGPNADNLPERAHKIYGNGLIDNSGRVDPDTFKDLVEYLDEEYVPISPKTKDLEDIPF